MKVIRDYKVENGDAQAELNAQASMLYENVERIFEEDYLSPEYRKEDVQIGHTYFLVDSKDKLMKRFEYQIIPILKEYYKDGIISFDVSDATDGFNGFLKYFMILYHRWEWLYEWMARAKRRKTNIPYN